MEQGWQTTNIMMLQVPKVQAADRLPVPPSYPLPSGRHENPAVSKSKTFSLFQTQSKKHGFPTPSDVRKVNAPAATKTVVDALQISVSFWLLGNRAAFTVRGPITPKGPASVGSKPRRCSGSSAGCLEEKHSCTVGESTDSFGG
ncbi:hypothetical protein BaRGS_00012508 [Batillaria attramentaria]|uniref:Uncharacterized protein n=1 Tax=Batillaria attramentaria TaxID=370345 RepID=A0ABD0LAF0_9CAEN